MQVRADIYVRTWRWGSENGLTCWKFLSGGRKIGAVERHGGRTDVELVVALVAGGEGVDGRVWV